MSYVVVVEDDERLAQGGGEPGVEGGVPLAVLTSEADDDDIGLADEGAGADGVEPSAFLIRPEGALLGTEDADPALVAGRVIGNWT